MSNQIVGDLFLTSLTSATCLVLPESIGEIFYCSLFNDDLEYAKEYLKYQEKKNKSKRYLKNYYFKVN